MINIDSMNMKQEKTERKIKKWTTFNSLGDTILAKEKKCKKKNMSYKRELKMKKELESIRTRSLDPWRKHQIKKRNQRIQRELGEKN